MNALKKRAQALETIYAHEAEMSFRAQARRNAMVGKWAAPMIGKADPEAYAKELAALAVEGDRKVFDKLRADFTHAGVQLEDDALNSRMVELLRNAARELHDHA
ncbi:MAG: hypothetical protein RLZZ444_3332 [Pseudomonadota bacterium]